LQDELGVVVGYVMVAIIAATPRLLLASDEAHAAPAFACVVLRATA